MPIRIALRTEFPFAWHLVFLKDEMMAAAALRYEWTFNPSPSIRDSVQTAIQFDNERYAVAPCHSGCMTAIVQRIGEAGEQYLYELRCICRSVIRTDGGMLPPGGD